MLTEKESKEIKSRRGGAREGAGRPPGAPNKLTRPLKELAAQYTEDSIHTLVTLRDHAESEQVRLQAANALLDRGHGRPGLQIDLTGDQSIMVVVQRQTPNPIPDVVPALPHHSAHDEAAMGDQAYRDGTP